MSKKSLNNKTAPNRQPDTPKCKNQASVVVATKSRHETWLLILVLLASGIIFFPALFNGFVLNWDDAGYITEYLPIRAFTFENLKTIFTSYHQGNYHPLTILTYAVEYSLVQANPFLYHLDNVLLHLANVLLVYVFIKKLTGRWQLAVITALLFGIHPLRVESVAWVSERKDVLYSLFFLLSLICYLKYVGEQSRKALMFGLSILFFVLSIISKPAAVCLPGVVILIDWFKGRKISKTLIFETIPFIAISLVFGIVAINSQKEIGAIQNLAPLFGFFERILLSFYALMLYVVKFIVPTGLSAMHPYPDLSIGGVAAKVYASPVIVVLLLALAVWSVKKNRTILFCSLFFLVNIALVLQILPVGAAIIAERYTYMPSIGFSMMLGFGILWIWEHPRKDISKFKKPIIIILSLWVIFLSIVTWKRIGVWQRGDYLFEDILLNYQNQPFVYNNLGFVCFNELKEYDRALYNYNRCIAIDSTFDIVYSNRGILYFNTGKYPEALKDFNVALRLKPDNTNAYLGRANTLGSLGRYKESIPDYDTYLASIKDNAMAYKWRGVAKYQTGYYENAIVDFNTAIAMQPSEYEPYYWRGLTLYAEKKTDEAIKNLSEAIARDNTRNELFAWRGLMYYNKGQIDAAIADYNSAIAINPKDVASLVNRSNVYRDRKQYDKALADLQTVASLGQSVDRRYLEEIAAKASSMSKR